MKRKSPFRKWLERTAYHVAIRRPYRHRTPLLIPMVLLAGLVFAGLMAFAVLVLVLLHYAKNTIHPELRPVQEPVPRRTRSVAGNFEPITALQPTSG